MSKLIHLTDIFYQTAKTLGSQTALFLKDKMITYQELEGMIQNISLSLQEENIQLNDKIAVIFDNSVEFIVSFFAINKIGGIVIPINPALTTKDIQDILYQSETKFVLYSKKYTRAAQESGFPGKSFGWEELKRKQPRQNDSFIHSPDHISTIIYTSGTTGKPKGVMLTHDNLYFNSLDNYHLLKTSQQDIFITSANMFHVYGLCNIMLTSMLYGSSLVITELLKPKTLLNQIKKHKVTIIIAVPSIYALILREKDRNKFNIDTIRVCHSGASAMPTSLIGHLEDYFKAPVQEGYGLSEASSIVCSNPLNGKRKPGSVGKVIDCLEFKVIDSEGKQVPSQEKGELILRGKTIMAGYYKDQQATQNVFTQDGFLKTGDIVYYDQDNYLYIAGRTDDLFKVDGIKVYPREIENVLYQLDDIEHVCVINDNQTGIGSNIKAFIQIKQGGNKLTPQFLSEFCYQNLPAFKRPKEIIFVDTLPRNANGKILRQQLISIKL